jgi:serine protease Do
VVGVNSAILSPTGGSVGIGFAIPSDTVRTVVAELKRDGHVTRGYLGIASQAIRPDMAAALHLPNDNGAAPQGALVASVEPDSPASRANLQPGDVILQVNGTKVTNPRDLAVDVAAISPGDYATLSVLRDGKTQAITAKVTSLPDQTAEEAARAIRAATAKSGSNGTSLALRVLRNGQTAFVALDLGGTTPDNG